MKTLRIMRLASPFLLSACGEGWEMIRTDKMVPYGNTRTAGTGVAYVRAKLLPEKDLNLKQVVRPMAPHIEAQPKPADKIFEEKQKK